MGFREYRQVPVRAGRPLADAISAANSGILRNGGAMFSPIRRGALVLPVLVIASAVVTAALPARAAGSWSSPASLPAAAGFSESASGAQLVVTGTGPAVSSSANGLSWSAPVAVGQGGTSAVTSLAPNGRAALLLPQ
jgi:hypothetical protein